MSDYTVEGWEAEMAALYGARDAPAACPSCGRTGFYGPRQDEKKTRRYRLCKFCGFGQDVGKEPVSYLATVHRCKQWLYIAGAPYIWWVPPGEDSYTCPYCHGTVNVATGVVPTPYRDRSHPWWNVPQGLPHSEYRDYWYSLGFNLVYV